MLERKELFNNIIKEIDAAYELISDYDSTPHRYGQETLYQAESYLVHAIGDNPGITVTDLAEKFDKTKSACSQLLRKLIQKGFVLQKRNDFNLREYLLYLTEAGQGIYDGHAKVNEFCLARSMEMVGDYSDEQLKDFVEIMRRINASFRLDIENDMR